MSSQTIQVTFSFQKVSEASRLQESKGQRVAIRQWDSSALEKLPTGTSGVNVVSKWLRLDMTRADPSAMMNHLHVLLRRFQIHTRIPSEDETAWTPFRGCKASNNFGLIIHRVGKSQWPKRFRQAGKCIFGVMQA